AAVAERAAAGDGVIELVEEGVVDHAERGLALALDADRDREARVAVRVVRGAVERVDHPAPDRAGAVVTASLFGEHGIRRPLAREGRHRVRPAGAAHLGHEVDGLALGLDRELRLVAAPLEGARLARQARGEPEEDVDLGGRLHQSARRNSARAFLAVTAATSSSG